MQNNLKEHIYVVDDDACIGQAVVVHLEAARFKCTYFEKADDCLRQLNQQRCDLLITDLRMPGKDGMELLAEVRHIAPWLPVLVMSAYGDIPLATKAVKAGAVDFVEKPIQWDSFIATVRTILKQNTPTNSLRNKPLTKTEKIVLQLILQNKSNKESAYILSRSIRTIEVHRSNIMKKFDASSVVELVKKALSIGWKA